MKDVKRFTQVNHSFRKVKDCVTVKNSTIHSTVELVVREALIVVCRWYLATGPNLEVLLRTNSTSDQVGSGATSP
jgi:hypothetical protein